MPVLRVLCVLAGGHAHKSPLCTRGVKDDDEEDDDDDDDWFVPKGGPVRPTTGSVKGSGGPRAIKY